MDRERLMEIIDSNGRFNLPTVELELLADHLIANERIQKALAEKELYNGNNNIR